MNRFDTADIEDVLPLLGSDGYANIKGYKVKVKSKRLECFHKSFTCADCGIVGEFFAIENHVDENPHLNLYAIDDDGNEVLMTKDHIKPKSKGGSNSIKNLQTMCVRCNQKKADRYKKSEELAGVTQ